MKYIISKFLNINNYYIKETNSIYKIMYSDKNIQLYGITFELKYEEYIENFNNYEFKINKDNDIYKYINFLNNNIDNLRSIIKEDKLIIKKNNKNKISDRSKIYINIGYVKKNGFFNIPIINIL